MIKQDIRTWAEVDLDAVRENVRAIRAALPEHTKFMGVVKADAYGHGAVQVSRAAVEGGASYLAAACVSEAMELRQAGVSTPILILGITPPEYGELLRENNISQAVSSLDYARALSAGLKGKLRVHMKLDTGMSRTGFSAGGAGMDDIVKALALPNLDYEGVFTHFAVSEREDEPFTAVQHERFVRAVADAEALSGCRFRIKHCANSGAVINYKEFAHDMVRPGVMLYGMYPGENRGGIELRPALALKSRVYAVNLHEPGDTVSYGRTYTVEKPERIAVIPIGYADGLHRLLSNRMDVLIRGRRCRQVGSICMDMCMVDVSGLPECVPGDVATIIGSDGNETISASELAEKCGSINYEMTCGIAPRVPRIYKGI